MVWCIDNRLSKCAKISPFVEGVGAIPTWRNGAPRAIRRQRRKCLSIYKRNIAIMSQKYPRNLGGISRARL
jgi:hypothetical protein